jgi:hypothetical protein
MSKIPSDELALRTAVERMEKAGFELPNPHTIINGLYKYEACLPWRFRMVPERGGLHPLYPDCDLISMSTTT